MNALIKWVKTRKTTATALVIALIVGIPLTFAVLHPGFPISDVQLNARDVWVTNGEQLLGGRLNRQIDELNGSVVAASAKFDVVQEGDVLFMHDPENGRLESVSPATTNVTSAIDIPRNASVSYGNGTLALTSDEGDVWVIDSAEGDLQFDLTATDPMIELGEGGKAVVTRSGTLVAISPSDKASYRMEAGGGELVERDFPGVGEFQLSAVGEQAVILDQSTNELVKEDGTVFPLGDDVGLRLQQVSEDSSYALVATGDALLKVSLGNGSIERVPANTSSATTDPDQVSAPVILDGCAHGAWAASQVYVHACNGLESEAFEIPQPTAGDPLEFRVNKSVIALNNLANGNVWLVDENMRLVENWEDVTPPQDVETEEGDEKSSTQSFEDTLAERTEQNRPPVANDDILGARPGRTTILPLLENDTDPDGDVLVITSTDAIAETSGRIDYIDGARALQYTPAEGYVGTVVFNYAVSDGRSGGTDEARVELAVRPPEVNEPPVQVRAAGVVVEANQTVTYNVLADWKDPDGDDLSLVGASPKSGDLVRFTPDGFITFTSQTSETGIKEVAYTVSDGAESVQGILEVDVQGAGTLEPIGTPDYAEAFVGQTVVVDPLTNDISPSGLQLALQGIENPDGASTSINAERGTVTFSASAVGTYYMKYTVGAGSASSIGIVRVDVVEPPDDELPPIAVKDIVYLRGESPSTVAVLANDVSPNGRVVAIQSIDVDPELLTKGLVVETLESTLIRVTSPAALTEQIQFTYTISDGSQTSSATVSIVPVPPLTSHQAPIAADDNVKVRVGDIVTVDVLDNDFHPDDSPMFVDAELVSGPAAGLAFVNNNHVRFQAPDEPGEYRVDYRVRDQFDETSAATVVFTVTGLDEENNKDPVPEPLVARVLAGGSITVDLPLNGVDPDGDSVQLIKFPNVPSLGVVANFDVNSFTYEATEFAAGTDSFTYQVVDAFGATGVGEIRIAVIPEPETNQNPNAVPDSVLIRPGRIAQVALTANDSDPQSAPIKVSSKLIDVPEGISVKVVDKHFAVIEAPDEIMSFSFSYELTNDRGGRSVSYVQVQVDPEAPLLPPTATDYVIPTADVAGKEVVRIELFPDYAFNPAGLTDDLEVTFDGPNAPSAESLSSPGAVEITLTETRQAIAYRVTNTGDDLDALAFILVPAAVGEEFDDPPLLDPNLPQQYVDMNGTGEWDLSDIVLVPSGRDAIITNPSAVTAEQGSGASGYVDEDTIGFTPQTDYRGPAGITFEVTDGASEDDPKGNKATLRLPVIVGDPEFRDTPPEFTPPTVNLEPGEPITIDLRSSTQHPNPTILQQVTYSNITGGGQGLSPSLSGSQLTLSVPRNTSKGTTYTVGVTLRWDTFEVQGSVNIAVVASSKPHAVAVTDAIKAQRGGPAVTVPALANDSNPFQTTGEPLRIIGATLEGGSQGSQAGVSHTSDSVTIQPGPGYVGDVVVVYTVEDATQDPDRVVNGRVVVTVRDVPAAPPAPTVNAGDAAVTVGVAAPPTSNGEPVDGYELTYTGTHWNGAGSGQETATRADCPPTGCTVGSLRNGWRYTFAVRAHNELGWSAWSSSSATATPYGTPAKVSTPYVSATTGNAPATVTWRWEAVGNTGGATTYHWSVNNGARTGSTTGTSAAVGNLGGGNYRMTVYATNAGDVSGPVSNPSAVHNVPNPPPPSPSITLSRGAFEPSTSNGYYYRVTLRNFPSGDVNIRCYDDGGAFASSYTVDHEFSGQLGCYSGYAPYHVIGDGVRSNTVQSW